MANSKKTAQIPLREMLQALDRNDIGFYSRLNEDERKAWSAWMTMRYASSATGADAYHYLLMTNSLVNVDFNTIRKHPQLQWMLLSICGKGSNAFHPWIAPGKKKKKDKIVDFLRTRYPDRKTKDLRLMADLLSTEELRIIAEDAGLDDKVVKELLK